MHGQNFGAGLFPLAIGSLLCLGGAVLVIEGWLKRRDEALFRLAEWTRNRSDVVNLVIVFACILVFGLFIRQIGFAVLTTLTTALLLLRFGQPWWGAVIAAVIAAAVLQYLFASLMRVPLPPGLLYWLIY
ncbi:MAG: tripartite tricarboxylate transporter TctB family protein [Rhizobiaceae bacterium]|nr:tripartite tricarboxylate transporter TctB family protein [Rhizobiaceae bacterium]MCV0408411.1 tripartite tricarboxylate transporter TctB family protein [Rhizobiaceae bacterium]